MQTLRYAARTRTAIVALLVLAARPVWSESITVKLVSGDVVTGELVERTDEKIVIDHALFGRLEIPTQQISADTLHPGLLGTGFLAGWDKNLHVGFSGSEGDTDEADLLVGLTLDYSDERKFWELDARYELSYADNDIDDHNARVTGLRDWLFPGSRWFAFAHTRYDYDDFESWEHRVSFGTGPGYRVIPDGALRLTARSGPFLTYEFGDEDDARPEGAFGLFALWTVRDGHTVRLNDMFLQTLDHSEFRNISKLDWRIRVAPDSRLSLRFGVENEYDSASEDSKNNLKYYTALSFDL
jgi:putative salt-induced outer membrane protein YdiY